MATMILSAAGASLGGAFGGTALGLGAMTVGRAAGGIAGGLIDQQVLGRGGGTVETGRVERFRLQGASEGAAVPKLWGRMRLGGQVIWASRFKEHVDESSVGAKGGGQRVREYSYTASFAVALCEGVIRRIGRVWADGNEISLADLTYRVHRGGEAQEPDLLIADIEGEAPAFRGVAYVVFENVPLGRFGNRIPQLNFEVFREPPEALAEEAPEEYAPRLSALVRGVAMSPGSGEFSLETQRVRRLIAAGQTTMENVNTIADRPDFMLGLEQLQEEAEACGAVSLIVSWFGDDLRCGRCSLRPCVEIEEKETEPSVWRASGLSRSSAKLVSLDAEGRPVFGGTPSDGSVIRSIQAMKAKGLRVMFYPFILMDVPGGNALADPWSGSASQPAFPWRGRITLDDAPGRPGSTDKTAAAADEVASFFGTAGVGDFSPSGETVDYSGPAEWGFRRFILHYAHLCVLAGGVDAFCIGSEMRGLTQIRSGAASYPAVARLKALAGDARAVMGPETKIGYAADWSEYFGHQPGDGTGDVFFHLDPLWADDDIDFVGIDNYLPLADWRYREAHADEAAGSVYSLAYLRGNVEGGEGYDWYYADAAAREAQARTPIVDTAHGEDWVFRPKDVRQWWTNAHHNRPGGARSATPTDWVPQSKPVWFTEIGCPAVDVGANQPNVFVDPKSSESFLPYYSRGVRDDYMQRRYLQAALTFWEDAESNPVSVVYGGPMVDLDNTYVWTWDARPFPDFPNRGDVWTDGENHRLGHWITGRLGSASLADVVAEICRASRVKHFDVAGLRGVVHGYVQDDATTGRAALQPLMMAFAFDAVESGGVLKFVHRDAPVAATLTRDDAALTRDGGAEVSFTRAPEGETPRAVRLSFIDTERDYDPGAVEAAARGAASTRVESASAPLVLDSAAARWTAERYLREARAGREGAEFAFRRGLAALEPGDVVSLEGAPGSARYRIETIEEGDVRRAVLTRVERAAYAAAERPAKQRARRRAPVASGRVAHAFLDLPDLGDGQPLPRVAAFASPWAGTATLFRSVDGESFSAAARVARPAAMGTLASDLAWSPPSVWSRGAGVEVDLWGRGLEARPDLAILNGANAAAVMSPSGEWEILQFQSAVPVAGGGNRWRLTRLLRGRRGTEPFIGDPTPAGARFVLLDDALAPVDSPAALRNVTLDWRIGPSRKPIGDEDYVQFAAADRAARRRPFAPARLRARRAANGDFAIDWMRRSRLDNDAWAGPDAPLEEPRELYRVRIGAYRVVETGSPDWAYDVAAQAADGAAGAVEIGVAQVSDIYGPGPEARITINV